MEAHPDLETFVAAVADPARGPAVACDATAELEGIRKAIAEDDVSGNAPYAPEELVRRAEALLARTDRLGRMSALAGRWAPVETGRVWPQILPALLDVRDRGNGLTPWLEMLSYPALLVAYAFGLGASVARSYDNLAAVLTAPTPDALTQWQPAVLQLNPATVDGRVATSLPGAKSRWPLSDHLLEALRPWFADIVPSGAAFDREFDRFEVLLCLTFYDLKCAEKGSPWAPIGRFGRHRRYDGLFHQQMVNGDRAAAASSAMLAALATGDNQRLAEVLAGFDEHVRRALGQTW